MSWKPNIHKYFHMESRKYFVKSALNSADIRIHSSWRSFQMKIAGRYWDVQGAEARGAYRWFKKAKKRHQNGQRESKLNISNYSCRPMPRHRVIYPLQAIQSFVYILIAPHKLSIYFLWKFYCHRRPLFGSALHLGRSVYEFDKVWKHIFLAHTHTHSDDKILKHFDFFFALQIDDLLFGTFRFWNWERLICQNLFLILKSWSLFLVHQSLDCSPYAPSRHHPSLNRRPFSVFGTSFWWNWQMHNLTYDLLPLHAFDVRDVHEWVDNVIIFASRVVEEQLMMMQTHVIISDHTMDELCFDAFNYTFSIVLSNFFE